MRKVKIVADSSANVLELNGVEFAAAPMKIIANDREFTDNCELDVNGMVDFFSEYKGRSQTSCPNPSDWIAAFGGADDVFCVTITSGLSGSFNSACIAKQMFESENEGKRVYVIDSLSAGPELTLIIEKLQELITAGEKFEDICRKIDSYVKKTGLLFMLESLNNFAANGRVSPAVAKIAGFLGLRIVGRASDKGTLEPLNKCRGESNSLATILSLLKKQGLSCGKVRIAHCRNESAAIKLKELINKALPKTDVQISELRGLCSYYAELGGLLVGFERV